MRALVNILALGCALSFAGVYGHQRLAEQTALEQVQVTQNSLARIRQEMRRRAGLADTELTARGWPATIRPEWFEGETPLSGLLTDQRPWMDIATVDEALLTHPIVRCDVSGAYAAFWYNPYLGIVRARVPYDRNDERTLTLYNTANECELSSLFSSPPAPDEATRAIAEGGIVPSNDQ